MPIQVSSVSPALSAALKAGLARDPNTLPRRRGRDPNHASLTTAEAARQDRIKADRDQVAAKLSLEPTLIANRAQLAQPTCICQFCRGRTLHCLTRCCTG